jgi:hypothetical protein
MTKKIIKTLLFRIWFFLSTLKTQNWVNKSFKTLCELDYDTPQEMCGFLVGAGFASVGIKDKRSDEHFAINETLIPNQIVVRLLTRIPALRGGFNEYWQEVYRTDESLSDRAWIWQMKKIMKYIKQNRIYEQRQKELLEKSQNGIM